MKIMASTPKHATEFKQQAAELYKKSGTTYAEAALEIFG